MKLIILIILSFSLLNCGVNKELNDLMFQETSSSGEIEFEDETSSDEIVLEVKSSRRMSNDEDFSNQTDFAMSETVSTQQEEPLVITKIDNRTSSNTNRGGQVVYKIPNEMTVRSTYQVIVRISKSTVHIYENLNGNVSTTTIPTTKTMEVKLIDSNPSDNKMFDIVNNNNGVQLVENNEEYTQWTWDITPLRKGKSKLKIVISIIKDGITKERVYEDSVIVKSDISKSIPFFIASYWKWIISTLVLPFIIWFFNKRKNNKKN
jgi:hypothetical protein